MVCKDKCLREDFKEKYVATGTISTFYRKANPQHFDINGKHKFKYCSKCTVFIQCNYNEKVCPCCHIILRGQRRTSMHGEVQKRHKQRYNLDCYRMSLNDPRYVALRTDTKNTVGQIKRDIDKWNELIANK